MKILLIDDVPTERALTIEALRRQLVDPVLVEITDTHDFEATVAQADFDLVITEYQLGWTDGLQLLRTLKSRFPCIPVIMLTASGNEEVAVKGMKSGLADYLTKQQRPLLAGAVEKCLSRPGLHSYCMDNAHHVRLCEKWDMAISRLTSDFAYALRVHPDGSLECEWVTEPYTQITGYGAKEAFSVGEWLVPIHPDDLPALRLRIENLVTEGKQDVLEYRIVAKSGETLWLRDHALPVRDKTTQRVARIYGAAQDITRRRKAEDELRLMRRALDSSNNGIVITGPTEADCPIIYANPAFLYMTGYSIDELLGRNPRFLQNDDREQPALEEVRTALREGREGYSVLRNYRKDGSMFWDELYIAPVRNEKGLVTHFVGIQNDVTQRIRMKALLSKSESQNRAILENVLDGIITINEQGSVESFNPAAEKIFGYGAAEVVGRNIKMLMPEPDRSRHDSYLGNYRRTGEPKIIGIGREVVGMRKDGTTFPMELGVSEIQLDQQRLFIGVIHDLAERKQNERRLQLAHESIEKIINSIPDPIFVKDRLHRWIMLNDAFCALVGYPRESMIGKSDYDFFPKEQADVFWEKDELVFNSGEMNLNEELFTDAYGTTYYIQTKKTPHTTIDGKAILIGVIRDITARKKIEDSLHELSGHLQSAREEERAHIAREIHDELGGLLAALKMDTSWLAKKLSSKELAQKSKVSSMNRMIDEAIQTVRKITTDLRPSILDNLGLLAAIEWKVNEFCEHSGIRCALSLPPEADIDVESDRATAVFRILQEALTNITLHSGAANARVEVQAGDGELVMTVTDDGKGATAQRLTSPQSFGILGMHERARHFGGDLRISSHADSGTEIVMHMPLTSSRTGSGDG
jgi:PAS domain S-box-containing protein